MNKIYFLLMYIACYYLDKIMPDLSGGYDVQKAWIPLAIGAAMGLAKYAGDKKQQARDVKLAAETARWSPWTGLNPNAVEITRPNLVGSVLKGAALGAAGGALMAPAAGAAAAGAGGATGALGTTSALPTSLGSASLGSAAPAGLGSVASTGAGSSLAGMAAPSVASTGGWAGLQAGGQVAAQPSFYDKYIADNMKDFLYKDGKINWENAALMGNMFRG